MKHLLSLLLLLPFTVFSQKFYRGNDLSYANEMEDCGAVFKENMQPKDVYQIFADHGTNLVRVRLWYKPDWQRSLVQPAGVADEYSNLADVEKTIRRAKDAGMEVMLGLHLSDFWADPAKQHIPDPWVPVATNLTALKDSVYNYVTRVLTTLNNEGLMPEIVKVGNETNSGILRQTTLNSDYTVSGTVSSSWSRHAALFNAAIKAVRDVSENTSIKPKIALHCAGLNVPEWWYDNIINNGVTDFDIMGFSYYYAWHGGSIQKLGEMIRQLKAAHPQYDPMVVETGYLWTTENFDAMPNIIDVPDPEYLPVIPEKQLEYMVDYTREVKKAGGIGVIFWEPDWVSTPCRTPWGQGSSQEHVAFFDPVNTNFMENGGGNWTEPQFYEDLNTVKVTFKVNMSGQDASNGVFIAGDFAGDTVLPMADEGQGVFSYFTYLSPGDSGAYYFLNGPDDNYREIVPLECTDKGTLNRKYVIPDHNITYYFSFSSCQVTEQQPVNVRLRVDMTGQDVSRGVYVTGEINDWSIDRMDNLGNNLYAWDGLFNPGDSLAYYYLTTSSWDNYQQYRETVPAACAPRWGTDREISVPGHDTTVTVFWDSCHWLVNTTFQVDMSGQEVSNGVYITGDMTGDPWQILPMTYSDNNIYTYTTRLTPFTEGAYFFLNDSTGAARENIPDECATYLQTDRTYQVPNHDTVIGYFWSSCNQIALSAEKIKLNEFNIKVYPNPVSYGTTILLPPELRCEKIQLLGLTGTVLQEINTEKDQLQYYLNLSGQPSGIYLLHFKGNVVSLYKKLIKK